MTKKVTDIITTVLGVILFGFALVAVWEGKITVLQSLSVIPVSMVLIVFKNATLEGVLKKLLKIK